MWAFLGRLHRKLSDDGDNPTYIFIQRLVSCRQRSLALSVAMRRVFYSARLRPKE